MKIRSAITGLIGILFGVGYVVFSNSIQNTEYIWYLTRIFGMVSILALFIVVFLGELKLLGITRFMKLHHFLGITAFFLVVLHFISAIFEKYQWGKSLSLIDYLGTNFSDKWMIFLSIGSIAFYLMLLISVTSAYSVMAKIGYKRWRLTHYLTYAALIFAFAHSIILGTEFNHSELRTIFFAITAFVFSSLLTLLALRTGKVKFDTKGKIAGFLLLILIVSGGLAYTGTKLKLYSEEIGILSKQTNTIPSQLEDMEKINSDLAGLIKKEQDQIAQMKKMSENVSGMIVKVKAANAAAQAAAQQQPEPTPPQVQEPPTEPLPPPRIEEEDDEEEYENDDENEYEDDD